MAESPAWRIDTSSRRAWQRARPHVTDVQRAVRLVLSGVPRAWHGAMQHLGTLRGDAPQWLALLEALEAIRDFDRAHGGASRWSLDDAQIGDLADRLAGEAGELDAIEQGAGASLASRLDTIRMLVRVVGVEEPRAIDGEPAIARAKCARWWRRVLRVHVARVVEAGSIKLGLVNRRDGGYASGGAVERRAQQCARNAAQLERTLYQNEAGQVYSLAELARGSVANPAVRGGELMVRIRGAEEYADEEGHVGVFLTMTCPSAFHAMTVGSGGRPIKNRRYDGVSTPRTSQRWLRATWARTRAELARRGVCCYGLRVAEPHHDGTPHWHALLWCETEEQAQTLEDVVRRQWLRDYGDEPGAIKNRVNVKRLRAGGAAGYVAKYVAKSVGHVALADSLDERQGELLTVDVGDVPGHTRVDAWAATWGIRQFQSIGMPPIGLWRELRRVTSDQADRARVQWRDQVAWAAWSASGAASQTVDDAGRVTVIPGAPSWARFMRAMGGHGAGRCPLRLARRAVPPGAVTEYGDPVVRGVVVGIECAGGRWLVSRRQAWRRVVHEHAQRQDEGERARQGAPWTRFNNCTRRLTGAIRKQLLRIEPGAIQADRWARTVSGALPVGVA